MFNRRFITKGEWKTRYLFTKYLLPFLVITGTIGFILGNRDSLFILTTGVFYILYVFKYTVPKDKTKKKHKKTNKKVRAVLEVIVILIGLSVLYDNVKYSVAMGQVQFQNDGYVTGKVRMGKVKDIEIYVLEEDKENNQVHKHVFEGWKYLSKVTVSKGV